MCILYTLYLILFYQSFNNCVSHFSANSSNNSYEVFTQVPCI
nr:MAG TPA: hypothetical protein [Caudoviricetes sp.]